MSKKLTQNNILVGLSVFAIGLGLAACGGSTTSGSRPDPRPFLQTHKLDLIEGDCSSYRGVTKAFVPTMVQIAENSAQDERSLWAACFDGAPLRTMSWGPTINFGQVPSSLNGEVAAKFNQARALGLGPKLLAMVVQTPVRAKGSGQLEALEVAAQTADVGRVFMISDAQIDEVGGVNLLSATPAQIQHLITVWAPRLHGLRGVQLWFIGVGFLAPTSASVRRSQMLFRGLAKEIGASCSWSQSLPVTFPAYPQDC